MIELYQGKVMHCNQEAQAVEILRFTCNPRDVDRFIHLDHEIWTKSLAAYDGFVSKDVWINKAVPGQVNTIIYWASLEQWKSIPNEDLRSIETRFNNALESIGYSYEGLHIGNDYYSVHRTVLI